MLEMRRMAHLCRFDAGEKPDFLPETKQIRDGNWKVGTRGIDCTVSLLLGVSLHAELWML